MNFRKKPVVIQAIHFDGTKEGVQKVDEFVGRVHGYKLDSSGYHVWMSTLEGGIHAEAGDWIIRGVAGEFYPCKPDIFKATYDEVNEQPTTVEQR